MRIREAGCLVGAIAVAVSCNARIARACSCDASPIFRSANEGELMDVPLNAAPVILGAFKEGSLTVEDELGMPVDVAIHEGPLSDTGCSGTWAEIVPAQPWTPGATYVVRVTPQYLHPEVLSPDWTSITFVTGVESLPDPDLRTPKARISVLDQVPVSTTCGLPYVRACLDVEGKTDRTDIELIARRGDKIQMRTLIGGGDLDLGFFALPDCFELRRRAPTGKRSEPLVICGDDLHVRELRNGDGEGGSFVCENATFEFNPFRRPDSEPTWGAAGSQPSAADAGADVPKHRAYGCAAVPGQHTSARGVLLLLGLGVGAWVRRHPSDRRRCARSRQTSR